MSSYTIFGRPGCGFCVRARQLLDMKKLPYKYVPQIFHGEKYVGGFTELNEYLKNAA